MIPIKAAVIRELKSQFKTETVYLAKPKGKEVLVEVKASGLCHSDLHVVTDDYGYPFPAIFGHEIAGVVESIGPDVADFQVGDHVLASLLQFCGQCQACLSGKTAFCLHPEVTLRADFEDPRVIDNNGTPIFQGYGISGFAEKSLVHQNQLAKIPKEIEFAKASVLGCGTITGAGTIINTANVRPGESVAVIGVGGVGLNAISGAKIAGATVIIAVDLQADKLALAKKFGATHTVNAAEVDPVKAVLEISNGGVDAALEVIGLTPTAEQAIAMTKLGGGAYLVGLQKPGTHVQLPDYTTFGRYGRNVQGVWMGSTNLKRDIPMYAELYLQGRMNLDDLVSEEIHIDDVQKTYEKLGQGDVIGRTVITSFK